jgi:hypothetical protein
MHGCLIVIRISEDVIESCPAEMEIKTGGRGLP